MNNILLAENMKQYLNNLKKEIEENKEAATKKAKNSLIGMGYLNESLEVMPPYNGEKVNDEDFSLGPKEFQYVKMNKR